MGCGPGRRREQVDGPRRQIRHRSAQELADAAGDRCHEALAPGEEGEGQDGGCGVTCCHGRRRGRGDGHQRAEVDGVMVPCGVAAAGCERTASADGGEGRMERKLRGDDGGGQARKSAHTGGSRSHQSDADRRREHDDREGEPERGRVAAGESVRGGGDEDGDRGGGGTAECPQSSARSAVCHTRSLTANAKRPAVTSLAVTVIAFIIGVLLLVVGLAVSIGLHEIGHLVPAKLFGVRVGKYMIGFGPTLWSRRIGETEYGIKALPLGGYISMAGMYPRSPDAGDAATARERTPGRFFSAMVQDARAANDETLGGSDDGTFSALPVYKRIVIMLGGPIMNFVLAIVLFGIVFSGIGLQTATTTIASVNECVLPAGSTQTTCGADDPRSPAAAAGILPGDQIVSVDGTAVSTFAEASAIIQASPNRTLPVVVDRAGERQTLQVTPMLAERQVQAEDGTVTTAEVGFVGMTATVEYVPQPIWDGPQAALAQTGQVFGIIWQLPVRVWDTAVDLVTGQQRDPNSPLSVVGAGRLAGEVAATDTPILNRVSSLLGILGALNIALFVFNLIPLLPLDGGHVVVALWDGLKRAWAKLFRRPPPRPVDATGLVPVTFVVVIALAVMGGVLILADIVNPVQLLG